MPVRLMVRAAVLSRPCSHPRRQGLANASADTMGACMAGRTEEAGPHRPPFWVRAPFLALAGVARPLSCASAADGQLVLFYVACMCFVPAHGLLLLLLLHGAVLADFLTCPGLPLDFHLQSRDFVPGRAVKASPFATTI